MDGRGGDNSGLGKLVFRTTNFGSSWDTIGRVQYPNNEFNYSVFFPSLNTGYCGGTSGYTYKTTNGGFNWYEQVITGGAFRRDFNFVNDTVGWVVGGGGHIFKTTTGGQFVSIEPISNLIPENFKLYQNYPNPFNSMTNVKFQIPKTAYVKISVYDILGSEMKRLVNAKLSAGTYVITFDANSLASGVYFYSLFIDGKLFSTNKMILSK